MIQQKQQETISAIESMKEETKEIETGKKLAEKAGDVINEIVKNKKRYRYCCAGCRCE